MKKLFTVVLSFLIVLSVSIPSSAETLKNGDETEVESSNAAIDISGVADGGRYNYLVTPIITGPAYKATLNGYSYKSGTPIENERLHTLKVVSVDEKVSKTISFTIDKTAPKVSTNVTGQKEISRDIPNLYVRNYNSDEVVLYYTINGQSKTVSLESYETYNFNEINSEGTYALSLYFQDEAGNLSETIEKNFTINRTGPEIYLSGVEEGGVYQSVTPIFTVNKGEVDARLGWNEYVSGTPITKEGTHTLTIEAEDDLGNITTKTVKFQIDRTGPALKRQGSYWNEMYILNASNFSVTSPITLLFDENINLNTINEKSLQLKNIETGQPEVFDFTKITQEKISTSYYNDQYLVTIPLKENLKESSRYKLTIVSSEITDLIGNSMNSENNMVMDLTTRQYYDAPVLAETNIDASEINSAQPIVLTFKESVQELDPAQISLIQVKTGQKEDVSVSVNDETVTIQSKLGLTENTEYQLDIEAADISSLDNIPMKTKISKKFKTADLFKIVSGLESKVTEKRPELTIVFSNPIDEEYLTEYYFTLQESGYSNRNNEIETVLSVSKDKRTVKIVPQTSLQSGETYELTISNAIKDIYDYSLASKSNQSFQFDVGAISTNIRKATNLDFRVINFKTVELSFIDNSQGEEGYYLEIDGDKQNMDYIPSVKGISSKVTHQLVFEKPSGIHSVRVIPVIDEGDEDYDHATNLSKIKLVTKKPAKPAEVKVKLLKDGSLEWGWKDIPSDYEGEASYLIIRKGLRDKVSSKNRTRSSNGKFIEKLNLDNETVVNNTITRYISRSVNIEGSSGSDYESDKVAFKIKLPVKPPTAFLKKNEYDGEQFTISWNMKDSKNVARKYQYILKRNKEIYWTSEEKAINSGKSSFNDTFDSPFWHDLDEEENWKLVVVTINSIGVKTTSSAKNLTFINN